jgi:low affinity Fe/Cu permease
MLKSRALERFSSKVTAWTGSSFAFTLAVATIVVWLVSGPIFDYSDTWQLVINTGTTIITFLMVFLVQRSQNKESRAIQLKLNELVAAIDGASNRLIDIEDLDEEELESMHRYYAKLVELARSDARLSQSHTIEEAERDAEAKVKTA